ncbi:hypothetical protein [Capnocytophaga canis]|uniref:Uncharacterized protein n=1 Tax=Capnocytophaga canis TaxID=1848903 RepID=A0A0B7IRY2_9FLAO|nr:hypothetical protein [Capnocytophaga canis]CEN53379.1 conserved hypothetical protein [Capnocytophaga canis]
MRITIATCWSELNAWQKKQIAYALLTFSSEDEKELQSFYTTLLKILVMQKNSLRGKIRWFRVLQQVPLSALLPYVEHFLSQKDLLDFPDISRELIIPGSRMNNCTIKQFSVCDAVFYKYRTCEHPNDKDLYARQLVASLYVLKSKKESKFDTLDLPKVADITDKIDPKLRYQIVFTFLCVREYITNRYKKIFPKPNLEDEQIKPDFRNRSYVPFSKVIHSMAMDERQPLGNLHECNKTLVYDFLDILQESIIRHEK